VDKRRGVIGSTGSVAAGGDYADLLLLQVRRLCSHCKIKSKPCSKRTAIAYSEDLALFLDMGGGQWQFSQRRL